MNKNNRVEKVSPDEMTILSNINSLINQLMQSGQATKADPEIDEPQEEIKPIEKMEGVDEPDENKKKEDETKKAKKAIENTPGDTASAQDDAEEILEDRQPEESTDNLASIAKQLLNLANSKKVIKSRNVSPVSQTLEQMVQVLKMQDDKINAMATGFEQLLDGLGVSKQLEIAKKEQVKRQPVMTSDSERVMKFLSEAINNNVQKSTDSGNGFCAMQSNSEQIRKNLRDPNLINFLMNPNQMIEKSLGEGIKGENE